MSRPTTSTRAGFMESQGCGAQILMSAATAIKMGATIYGIVAHTHTATDKQGRSVPAPGLGILGSARQVNVPSASPSKLLDLGYRKRQLAFRRKQIGDWLDHETALAQDEPDVAGRLAELETEARRQESEAQSVFGMLVGSDPTIAPLKRALAVWNLTVDDINVASFHGTSTVANDKNESSAFNQQFAHLGRAKGNPALVIAQKWLTGHPKGGAAAWMMNGLAQSLLSGIVPGNVRSRSRLGPR